MEVVCEVVLQKWHVQVNNQFCGHFCISVCNDGIYCMLLQNSLDD